MRGTIALSLLLLGLGCGQSDSPSPAVADPVITDFTPKSGGVGATVTITGSNFGVNASDNVVKFNNIEAVVTSSSSSLLVVVVPAGNITGSITVSTNNKLATSTGTFVGHPQITGFYPKRGPAGTLVTILGFNFSPTPGDNTVTINGLPSVVTGVVNNSNMMVSVPDGDYEGFIHVTVNGNTVTSDEEFKHACMLLSITRNNSSATNVLTYEYNSQNQVTKITVTGDGASVITHTYNNLGQLITRIRTSGTSSTTTTYSYNSQGRVVSDLTGTALNIYSYNSTGQVVRIQAQNAVNYVEYGYPNTTTTNFISESFVNGASITTNLYEYDDKRFSSRDVFPSLNFLQENNWTKQTIGAFGQVIDIALTYNAYGYPETTTWSGDGWGTTVYTYKCD